MLMKQNTEVSKCNHLSQILKTLYKILPGIVWVACFTKSILIVPNETDFSEMIWYFYFLSVFTKYSSEI